MISRRHSLALIAALFSAQRRQQSAPETSLDGVEFSAGVWPGRTIESKEAVVSGRVTKPAELSEIRILLDESSQRVVTKSDFPRFRISIPVSGGDTYQLIIVAVSSDGSTQKTTVQTRHVIDSPPPEETDRLVGTHYYPWYGEDTIGWDVSDSTPLLGTYSSDESAVISQHIQWLALYGINWLSASWWGKDSYSDTILRDHIISSRFIDSISFSILYETKSLLDGGNLDSDENRQKLINDVRYLSETYFDHEQYLLLDGRPVLFLYGAGTLSGDVAAALEAVEDAVGIEIFFIGDIVGWQTPVESGDIPYDAISPYTMYTSNPPGNLAPKKMDRWFSEYVEEYYRRWSLIASETDVPLIPLSMPGFDDRSVRPEVENPVIERSVGRFEELSSIAGEYSDSSLDAVMVTSFNEWPEATQIEPTDGYLDDYLKVVPETLAVTQPSFDPKQFVPITIKFSSTVSESEIVPDGKNDRELAFRCFRLQLIDEDELSLAPFDVGKVRYEPAFVEGVYYPEWRNSTTWRWFGGPMSQTRFYIPKAIADVAAELVLSGKIAPGRDNIDAIIEFNGKQTDRLTLNDYRSYSCSLESD
nr:glycoside hydrolase family 99-like domain-containing protein [Halomicroarcula limicola]